MQKLSTKLNFVRVVSTLVAMFFAIVVTAQTVDRPNILWIVSEDNNTDLIHCYGNAFATTPNIDKLATEGVRYTNAFSTAPVCAPSRHSLITGMYPPSMGTEHMRSTYPVPDFVKFFPRYLREAGYYTTNNAKKDYNTVDQPETWDESSDKATYKNRKPGQPFFAVFNLGVSHESGIHIRQDSLRHDPKKVPLPPYHPDTKEFREDWAQYYDKVETMDQQVGQLLKELEQEGLADNTIVFYYADNGGVLPRSKRFMYESGLHVPLVIRLPAKYKNLSSNKAGTTTDRIVTFVDFAPTILSLAGIKIPEYIQGKPFLGNQQQPPRDYAYGFRGRMDERIDMSRTLRDKKYRYIRNYLPHLPYGQHLIYLWQAASMRSWENEFRAGRLNEVQSVFWKQKPAEELYDVEADPYNINNLAGKPQYEKVLLRLRRDNHQWLIESKDIGFIPEAILCQRAQRSEALYTQAQHEKDMDRIIETAEMASSRDVKHLPEIIQRLTEANPSVRYWAAVGCTVLKAHAVAAKESLLKLLADPEIAVRIAGAEALYNIGEKQAAVNALSESLKSENQFARLQALNVLQTLGNDALPALEQARSLIPADPKLDDYNARAAQTLIETIQDR
ncbi:MAG TPA: sulfatase-like hydrolase/transferase [Chryseolinea sp.]